MKEKELIETLRVCTYGGVICPACPRYNSSVGMAQCYEKQVLEAADTIESQQKRIAELEAALREQEKRRWIPVAERFPDRNGEYICRHGYNGNTDIKFTGVLEYYATDEKPHWQHESIGLIVTHWMPLPEPPKEDE